MTMTAHTLPSNEDRGHIRPHPDGRPWTLDDFHDDIPLDPSLRWNDAGVVILKNFIPSEILTDYRDCWEQSCGPITHNDDGTVSAPRLGGWSETQGYMDHEPVMRLFTYKPLHDVLESLIGEPPVVHLGLTGIVSSARGWHGDRVLNPVGNPGDRYGAAWVATGPCRVHPDAGPFQYFEGSHEWFAGGLSKELMGRAVNLSDPRWPAHTEDILGPLYDAEAERRGVEPITYLPDPGDVLLWAGRTIHRGQIATTQNAYRGAAIFHMSGSLSRPDFPYRPRRWRDQGFYMPYPEAVSPLEQM